MGSDVVVVLFFLTPFLLFPKLVRTRLGYVLEVRVLVSSFSMFLFFTVARGEGSLVRPCSI